MKRLKIHNYFKVVSSMIELKTVENKVAHNKIHQIVKLF